jgi:glycine cleavage system H protein
MNVPTDLKYTQNDEWIRTNDGAVGITDHAQEQLSDIVFVEILVAEGDTVHKGDTIATVESVKAAADVYSPASGTVTAVNEDLASTPDTINKDPFGQAWMIKLETNSDGELSELLDPEAYGKKIAE